MTKTKKVTESLDIKRIAIIDDDFHTENDGIDFDRLNEAFYLYKDDVGRGTLIKELKEVGISVDEIGVVCKDDYEVNNYSDINLKIRDFLVKNGYFEEESSAEQLDKLCVFLKSTFKKKKLLKYEKINEKVKLRNNDLIIVDYNLDKQSHDFKGYAILNKIKSSMKKGNNNGKEERFYYILFISSRTNLEYGGNSYDLTKLVEKNEFFRKLRSEFDAYDFVVFNYLHKDLMDDESALNENFQKIIYEFSITKAFYNFLKKLSDKIDHSKSIIFKDFYSLNLRTIKKMIKDNIEKEGISEFEFFNDLICNLISKENSDLLLIKDIHNSAYEIKCWKEPLIEYYLDKSLLEIRKKVVYMEVNKTFMPIQFGDIFTIHTNDAEKRNIDVKKKSFASLLISQECDMTIRNNGERSNRNAVLLKDNKLYGCCENVDKYIAKGKGTEMYHWYLRDPIIVPCDILDLASIHPDGKSILNIDINVEDAIANVLSENHKDRIRHFYNRLVVDIRKTETDIQSISESSKDNYRILKINDVFWNYTIDPNGVVDFRVERINRLDKAIVQRIQQEYVNQLKRIGQQLDFTGKSAENKELMLFINECKCSNVKVKLVNDMDKKQIYIDEGSFIGAVKRFSQKHAFLHVDEIYDLFKNISSEPPIYSQNDNKAYIKIGEEELEILKNNNFVMNLEDLNITIKLKDIKKICLNCDKTIYSDDIYIRKTDEKLDLLVINDVLNDLGIDYKNLSLKPTDIESKGSGIDYVNINAFNIRKLLEFTYDKEEDFLIINHKE